MVKLGVLSPVGNYSPEFGGPVIRYQQVVTLGWQWNVWSANLFNRYQNGYLDQNPAGQDNKVHDYSVTDISGQYRGFKGLTLQAGILNVFDQDPPFSNSCALQCAWYDTVLHPLAVVQVAASYQF